MSVCKHCEKPIELIPDIYQGRGQWVHRNAWVRCETATYAHATPKEAS